jgi:hypothetical protein
MEGRMSVERFRRILNIAAETETNEITEVANIIDSIIIPVLEDLKDAVAEKLPIKDIEITKSSHAVVLMICRPRTKFDAVDLAKLFAHKLQANVIPNNSGRIRIALTFNSAPTESKDYSKDELTKDAFEEFVSEYCVTSGFTGLIRA